MQIAAASGGSDVVHVARWYILMGVLCFKIFSYSLSSLLRFCILNTSLWEEGGGLCDSRFVRFARMCFCSFSLPFNTENLLRFVTVAYPGTFYQLICVHVLLHETIK